MGVGMALILSNVGAAYGTAKSSIGIANLGLVNPNKIFRALIPIIMAGILGIYGLIVGVILSTKAKDENLSLRNGFMYMGAGLCCGFSSLASGLAIGVAGEAGVKAYAQTDNVFVGMILMLIFAEAIGLYGLIVAIIMSTG
jgi:V-type H+-transporting ATPase proteolipid subunit